MASLCLDNLFDFKPIEAPEPPRADDGTPAVLGVVPEWLPPLCDAYTEDGTIYLWHKLVLAADDLEPERCGTVDMGRPPEWMAHEDDLSLYYLMGPPHLSVTHDRHSFIETWIRWALEEGLAPGQPFLVRISQPHYSRSYEGEYDVDWDVDIVRVMPRTPQQALRAWDRTLKLVVSYRNAWIKRWDRLKRLQIEDTDALCIQTDHYFPSRYGYDEMTPPSGLRVTLCSKHNSMYGQSKGRSHPAHLISGEDDEGRYDEAFRDLLKNVQKYYPEIPLVTVLAKSHRRIGLTRYDWLEMDGNDPI